MPKIEVNEDLCKGCGLCIRICPKQCIEFGNHLNVKGFHPATYMGENCIGCKACATTCPEVAIEVFK
ncbi:MAG: ferredoxin family protein [Spirochaetales bacterium]|nr:ferredoxin family protein [Spirochaetales bacterium]